MLYQRPAQQKNYLLGFVRLTIGTGDAVRIGKIAGNHIQTLRLRAHGRTGNVKYIKK
jgi:hypothetical protein